MSCRLQLTEVILLRKVVVAAKFQRRNEPPSGLCFLCSRRCMKHGFQNTMLILPSMSSPSGVRLVLLFFVKEDICASSIGCHRRQKGGAGNLVQERDNTEEGRKSPLAFLCSEEVTQAARRKLVSPLKC